MADGGHFTTVNSHHNVTLTLYYDCFTTSNPQREVILTVYGGGLNTSIHQHKQYYPNAIYFHRKKKIIRLMVGSGHLTAGIRQHKQDITLMGLPAELSPGQLKSHCLMTAGVT